MIEPWLRDLKRRGEVEDGLAVLHRDDASGGETSAIADGVDHVDDRMLRVAGAQEVPVQAVHRAPFGDGLLGGGERLSEHLSPEHPTPAEVLALAPEDVLLDPLQAKDLDQLGEYITHLASVYSAAAA